MSARLRALLALALLAPLPAPGALALPFDAPAARPSAEGANATIFHEAFAVERLRDAGWEVERMRGDGGWRVADAFALLESEGRVATTGSVLGAYAEGMDARLLSPPIDLRAVPGAPIPRAEPPLPPIHEEARAIAGDAARPATENLSRGVGPLRVDPAAPSARASARDGLAAFEDALVWPPGENTTRALADLGAVLPPEPRASDAPVPNATLRAPAHPEGVARVRLSIEHAWDFAPGDGGFVEIRARDGNGEWSAWRRVAPAPPEGGAARVERVAEPRPLAMHTGELADGGGAFTLSSNGLVASEYALETFAGRVVQIAFRVASASPLPPTSFGWALRDVRVTAALGPPDVAIEGFGPLVDGAVLAMNASWTPTARVRNWGALEARDVTVRIAVGNETGAPLASYPRVVRIGTLAPGEARDAAFLPLPSRAGRFTLEAVVRGALLDARPENDASRANVTRADVERLALALSLPPADAITAPGRAKTLHVEVANLGNVASPARVALVARPVNATTLAAAGPAQEVAVALVDPPAADSALASGLAPLAPPARAELSWTPTVRGAWSLIARGGGAESEPVYAFAGVAPPPTLREPFAVATSDARPWSAEDPALLAGWTFDAWNLTAAGPSRTLPAPPSGTRMLAARARDALAGGGFALVGRGAAGADEGLFVLKLNETLPVGVTVFSRDATALNASPRAGTAEILYTAGHAGCEDPTGKLAGLPAQAARFPLACENPADRLPTSDLASLTVGSENLTLAKRETVVEIRDASVATGNGPAGLVWVRLDATVQPGLWASWSPFEVARAGGDAFAPVPAAAVSPYEDAGLATCCIVGPFRASDLAAAAPRVPVPATLESTAAIARYSASRALDDLLAFANASSDRHFALAFEHQGRFAWREGTGVRGLVTLEGNATLPPEIPAAEALHSFEDPIATWEPVVLPIEPASVDRVRLTLEVVNATGALPRCPYLDPGASCEAEPAWLVDDLRLLARGSASEPWRVVARDAIEDALAASRWAGDWSAPAFAAPSLLARGWSVEDARRESTQRWELAEAGRAVDAEIAPSRALRWGEPGAPSIATTEPVWSIASTPLLDLSALTAPTVRFATRYDFGPERAGAFPAGGAVVLRPEHGRRLLLAPAETDGSGEAYRADVDAPAFAPLARALSIEAPRSTPASAFVGASGRGIGETGAPRWVGVAIDLAPYRALLASSRVAIELHAVSARALPAEGWTIDDLRVGEPGPAVDVALAGLAPRAGVDVARGEPVPILVNVTNLGMFRPRGVVVDAWIENATGGTVYGPARLALPDAGAGAVAPGLAEGGDARVVPVAFPLPWIPREDGEHVIRARVRSSELDEAPWNDAAARPLRVRDALAARFDAPPTGIASGVARVDEPVAIRVTVENAGTLAWTATRRATVIVDVIVPGVGSALASPIRADVAATLRRPLAAGERADIALERAWVPRASGTYLVEARLDLANETAPNPPPLAQPLVVWERAAAPRPEELEIAGDGWTNATRGTPPTIASFAPRAGAAEGALELPTLNLRAAARATVELRHRYSLEEGFDGGRLEVLAANSTWEPLAPAGGYPGELHAPTALALPGERAADAFTGRGGGVATFDLANVASMREPFVLLSALANASGGPTGDLQLSESSLAPTLPFGSYYAGPRAAPEPPAGEWAARERRDVLAFPFLVPAEAEGALVARFEDWRAIGLSGAADSLASGVEVAVVEGACAPGLAGARFVGLARQSRSYADNYRAWTPVEATFAGALPRLAGKAACLVVEHVEVAARIPDRLVIPNGSARYASDLVSPHGGYATTTPRVAYARGGSLVDVPVGAPLTGSTAAWIPAGGGSLASRLPDALAEPATGTPFAVAVPPAPVWSAERGALRAVNGPGLRDAALVFPVDLTPVVARAELTLRERHALLGLADRLTGANGTISAAGVRVSVDGGATWTAVPPRDGSAPLFAADATLARHSPFGADPEGNSPWGARGVALAGASGFSERAFDLSPWAGLPVLVALHASFSTSPAARDDFWEIDALRVEGDLLRGGDVKLRLRAASDANGASVGWDVESIRVDVVRHAAGAGIRLLEPRTPPVQEGYRALVIEVVNRGSGPLPRSNLSVSIREPAELGGRTRAADRFTPPIPAGESAFVRVRGADFNWFLGAGLSPASATISLAPAPGEGTTADNRLQVALGGADVVARSELAPVRVDVSPQALDAADVERPDIVIVANVTNLGEDAATLAWSRVKILDGEGRLVRALDDGRATTKRLGKLGEADVRWSWRPEASFPPGAYTVLAEIATAMAEGATVRNASSTLHVTKGPPLNALFAEDRFGPARGAWSCVAGDACASEDRIVNASAPASLAIGLPGATSARAVVESPEFPVLALDAPRVRLLARHALPAGERALVDYAPVLASGARGAFATALEIGGRSRGFDEGAFEERAAELRVPPGARGVVLRVDAPAPAPNGAPSLWIDDVSVSPLAFSVEPPPRAIVADAVEKRLRFRVENDGALSDAYAVRLADARARAAALPAGWSARVEDAATGAVLATLDGPGAGARVVVPARASREVDLVVLAPPSAGASPLRGAVPVPILLESTLLPGLSRAVRATLEAAGAPRAELVAIDARSSGSGEPAGRARAIEVALANRGLAGATTRVTLSVEAPESLGEEPETLRSADGSLAPEVSLPPGASRTVTFPWTPRHAGAHRLVARVDPDSLVVQANRSNDAVAREVVVPPLPYPDVRVSLDLPSRDAHVGDATVATITVENRGAAVARSVELTLRAGVARLLDEDDALLGDLAPGERREIAAPWTPETPGETRVTASAFARAGAPEGVETMGDNAATRVVRVREDVVRVSGSTPAAAEGGVARVAFVVRNGGNAADALRLVPVVPDGWSAIVEVEGEQAALARLEAGESANAVVVAILPEDARAGKHAVELVALGERARGEAAGTLVVPALSALSATLLAAPVDPHDPALTLLVANDGNAPERLAVEARRLPARWRLEGATLDVPAGATVRARLALHLGGSDAPRAEDVLLAWSASGARGFVGGPVGVAAAPRVRMEAAGEAAPRAGGEARVTLSNDGNAPAVGVLRALLPDGWSSSLDGLAVTVPPRESVTVTGRLAAPRNATASARGSVALLGAGTLATAPIELALAERDLALAALTRLGDAPPAAGALVRWRATVANPGSSPIAGARVVLFVDGTAVSEAAVGDLAPGAVAEDEIAWLAEPGARTLVALAVAGDAAEADADPTNDARAVTLDVPQDEGGAARLASLARSAPAAPALAVAVALAAAAALGRRRGP